MEGKKEIKVKDDRLFAASIFFSFTLLKYDNMFTGDLENTEQGYIWLHYITIIF